MGKSLSVICSRKSACCATNALHSRYRSIAHAVHVYCEPLWHQIRFSERKEFRLQWHWTVCRRTIVWRVTVRWSDSRMQKMGDYKMITRSTGKKTLGSYLDVELISFMLFVYLSFWLGISAGDFCRRSLSATSCKWVQAGDRRPAIFVQTKNCGVILVTCSLVDLKDIRVCFPFTQYQSLYSCDIYMYMKTGRT